MSWPGDSQEERLEGEGPEGQELRVGRHRAPLRSTACWRPAGCIRLFFSKCSSGPVGEANRKASVARLPGFGPPTRCVTLDKPLSSSGQGRCPQQRELCLLKCLDQGLAAGEQAVSWLPALADHQTHLERF